MKILVVSLLRLGDFLQTAGVVDGLARKYPGARIDFLTFEPVKALAPLMSPGSRWWTLHRDELQSGLGRADVPLLTAFDVLKQRMDEIEGEAYDLVVNLTHTAFAGYLCGYLKAGEKLGLAIDRRGQSLFHSSWFRYLDANARVSNPDIFNYTDIYAQGCGVNMAKVGWPLKPTEQGLAELEGLALKKDTRLVCQIFTSDPKKNWPVHLWVQFLNSLRQRQPDWQFIALAAPQEEEQLRPVLEQAPFVKKALLSLDGALALLQDSDLLVTGDTSIKHLANAADIPVLELCLGSSDPARTGIYKEDSLILQARGLECSPCPHAQGCSRSHQICADMMSPSEVVEAALALRAGDWQSLRAQAAKSERLAYRRTRHLECGFWFAEDLAKEAAPRVLDGLLERTALRFWLNREHDHELAGYGSESVHIQNEVNRLLPETKSRPLLAHLDFLEKECETSSAAIVEAQKQMAAARAMNKGPVDLAPVRKARARLESEMQQKDIKRKLVRSLKSRWMESK